MRKNKRYIPIIGLEIHVELKTNSKMFCGCKNDPFHAPKPNIYTCPVCLGLPGALPVPNKKAIEWTVLLGLALGCKINKNSRFDRKHYFYPDLPKGYQISQYEQPFCRDGEIVIGTAPVETPPLPPTTLTVGTRLGAGPVEFGRTGDFSSEKSGPSEKDIKITRVHLEEDTGKLLHRTLAVERSDPSANREEVSLIDFNRSGVPLVEIVTEPDIRSAAEAKQVAQKIRQMVRFLEISDADMEKGSMRLEANVSLSKGRTLGTQGPTLGLPNYKVELKNINSFRFLEKAINQEIERQERILSSNKAVKQQTFGWDTEKQVLKPQRVKESAADYRYFPEPDIPPISFTGREIANFKLQIPKLSDQLGKELEAHKLPGRVAEIFASDKKLSGVVAQVMAKLEKEGKQNEKLSFANWLTHCRKQAQSKSPDDLLRKFRQEKKSVVDDEKRLEVWVKEAVKKNRKAAEDYRGGKPAALQFLIGQVQRRAGGKAKVSIVRKLLMSKLDDAN